MSAEESLKRKSPEIEFEKQEEPFNEPQTKVQKVQKVGDEDLDSNLKDSEECNQQKVSNGILKDNKITQEYVEDKEEFTKKSELASQSLQCSISIKFHDQAILDKYQSKFLKFVESFIEFQVEFEADGSINLFKDENISRDEWVIIDESKTETVTNTVETSVITNVVEQHTNVNNVIFVEEESPKSKKRKKRSKAKKELFVVDATPSRATAQTDLRYITKFTINAEKATEEIKFDQLAKQSCFNCGQLHSLKDCPLPKDYHKINLARQKFRQLPKTSRYHSEEQKYSHLIPGKLSSELRKALGLYKNETPHYIYLMRKHGYPPGWLEEAKLIHSNLEMFDIDGNNVKTMAVKRPSLDPTKIVEFPGFNVPFEKGMKDDYRRYGVPPFSNDFSKEAMINFFDKKFAQEEDNFETCDMDIDHEHESSNQEKEIEPKSDVNEDESRDSPSLLDLEQQKQQLLEELKDETKDEKLEKDFLSVKTTHFGTPILKSSSPYSTLPHPDKFSKDVSPVINFENLPNSTGKYEQMTDVLQKVRSALKKIHNCNT